MGPRVLPNSLIIERTYIDVRERNQEGDIVAYPKVTDKYGLVENNNYLVVFVPASEKAIPFKVLARQNYGGEVLNYGALPITASEVWGSYDGGTTTAPAAGVTPGRAYTSTAKSFTPLSDMSNAYDSGDMWYLPYDYRERLFHIRMKVTPSVLRCGMQIPKGASQQRFQKDRVILGVDKSAGFERGGLEYVQFPEIHYGFTFGNDTNIEWYTNVKFLYGEYKIGIPADPDVVFNVLDGRINSHWVTMPVSTYDATLRVALEKSYGFDGFELYSPEERAEALVAYKKTIERAKRNIGGDAGNIFITKKVVR